MIPPEAAGLGSLCPDRPLVIGHRGAPGLAPENTIPSFRMALANGADMVELDVRMTSDGVAVVHHDETLSIRGGRQVRIADTRLEVLRQLAGGDEVHLPTLEAVFETLGGGAAFDVELKEEGLAGPVLELLHRFALFRHCVVTSFQAQILKELGTKESCVPVGRVHAARGAQPGTLAARWLGRSALKEARAAGHSFVALEWQLLNSAVARQARRYGIRVLVWTVDQPEEARRLADLRVFGVITNEPRRIADALAR